MELELDFSDHEELEFADRSELETIAADIEKVISGLVHSFSVGNVLKNGIPVAIVGETNAGKSTLLNTLLNEEKAIVSDIHGTTRDVIEDTVNLSGITFRFIDTAGIRDTKDKIESMGIERTYQKIIPGTPEENIRTTKHRKSGSPEIINALMQVAQENKQLLNL
jgi:tRNA modification GTPase